MRSSPDWDRAGQAIAPLPPALSSMWRLCKLGYRHEPRLMVSAFVLSQLAALPDALLALWLMLLGKGVIEHRPGVVKGAAIGLGVSTAATWFLRTVSTRVQRRFRDKVTNRTATADPGSSTTNCRPATAPVAIGVAYRKTVRSSRVMRSRIAGVGSFIGEPVALRHKTHTRSLVYSPEKSQPCARDMVVQHKARPRGRAFGVAGGASWRR
jgi:hypothetical protein